jgi:hypothetical protein
VSGTRTSRWRNKKEKKAKNRIFGRPERIVDCAPVQRQLCGSGVSRGSLTCQKLHIRPDPLPVDAAAPARKRGLFFCSLLSVSLSNRRQFKKKLFLKLSFSVNLTNLICIFFKNNKVSIDFAQSIFPLIRYFVNGNCQSGLIDQF